MDKGVEHAPVAQWIEQRSPKARAAGSIPARGTHFLTPRRMGTTFSSRAMLGHFVSLELTNQPSACISRASVTCYVTRGTAICARLSIRRGSGQSGFS